MADDHMLIFQLMRLPDMAAGNRKGQGVRPDGSMVQAWLWYLHSYSTIWLQAAHKGGRSAGRPDGNGLSGTVCSDKRCKKAASGISLKRSEEHTSELQSPY